MNFIHSENVAVDFIADFCRKTQERTLLAHAGRRLKRRGTDWSDVVPALPCALGGRVRVLIGFPQAKTTKNR